MIGSPATYPVTLSVDYPDRPLNGLTTFFRIITVIPIAIIFALLGGMGGNWREEGSRVVQYSAGGLVVLPTLLMVLFQQKYPRWWFDWNLALTRFSTRVCAYLALMRDEYPSTDEEQAVHLDIAYPDARKDLNRWLPLVKWLLGIPHYVVLVFLYIAVIVCEVIAWFAILFTGRYPRGLFDFIVGVLRWSLRVHAHAFLLTTDRYPPFALRH
ncbi:MAG: DUF4389 domain-containing protein [Chloroflexota bacterium]